MEDQATASAHAECEYEGILGYSEDSDEELISGHLQATSCNDPSILSRLGLSSCEDMTEEEVESAFVRFAMAFHCDQYTLMQRLHAEEHDCVVAQENLQVELQHTRTTLQMLRGRLVEDDGKVMVKRMEECLHSLENNIPNIITTAENLGTTHQEARISHAVELMSLHVEHLKQRQTLENTELLEIRKVLQYCRSRIPSDSTEDGELRQYGGDPRQHLTRRRVSVTLIPTQTQMMDLEVKLMESCRSGEKLEAQERCVSDLQEDGSAHCSPAHLPVEPTAPPANELSTDGQERDTHSDSQVGLRWRRHHSSLEQTNMEEREGLRWWEDSSMGPHDPNEVSSSEAIPTETFGLSAVQHPLLSRLAHCRRQLMALLVMCVTCLVLFILLFYLRSKLHQT